MTSRPCIRFPAAMLFSFSLAVATSAFSVEQLPCGPATELAKRAYTRIVSTAQPVFAVDHRTAFWDIYEYASSCPQIETMATELRLTGHVAQTKNPSNDDLMQAFLGSRGLNLPSSCFGANGFSCEIIISNPGGGNTAGQIANWFLLDRDKLKQTPHSEFKWRAIDSKKIQLPARTDIQGR